MNQIAQTVVDEVEADRSSSEAMPERAQPVPAEREWTARHPINLRVTLPMPFGRWYVTLVAGRERRSKERLSEERLKHPLETGPNLLFLFSLGIVGTALLLTVAALVLTQGLGWSIQLVPPT